jgi:hypothetical protein
MFIWQYFYLPMIIKRLCRDMFTRCLHAHLKYAESSLRGLSVFLTPQKIVPRWLSCICWTCLYMKCIVLKMGMLITFDCAAWWLTRKLVSDVNRVGSLQYLSDHCHEFRWNRNSSSIEIHPVQLWRFGCGFVQRMMLVKEKILLQCINDAWHYYYSW